MNYRKIWKENYGDIPKDKSGRSYEIHHIDGNRDNNDILNLKCISISDHFYIHLKQGNFLASASIARRMKLNETDIKALARFGGIEARDKKLGIFALTEDQKRENSSKGGKAVRGKNWFTDGISETKSEVCPGSGWKKGRSCKNLGYTKGKKLGYFWNNGIINMRFLECPGPEWKKGKLLTQEQRNRRSEIASSIIRSKESNEKRSQKLKNIMKEKVICNVCGKIGGIGAMKRWHFENCKGV